MSSKKRERDRERDRERESESDRSSIDVNGKKSPSSIKSASPHDQTNATRGSPPTRSYSSGKSSPIVSVTENSNKSEHCKSASPSKSNSSSASLSSAVTTASTSSSQSVTHTTSTLSELARSVEAHNHDLALHYSSKANGMNSFANCCTPGASALASQIKPADNKSQPYPSFSPYSLAAAGYAAMKSANGAFLGTTTAACRDPYCTNCQLAATAGRLPCPSGCTQCNHDRIPTSLGSLSSTFPPIPGLVPGFGSSLYSQASLAPPGLVPPSNVCSWMVNGTYCGKRFATSEELLNHLRTHTNLSSGDVGASLLSPLSSLSGYSHFGGLAGTGSVSGPSSLTSSAGLRRTFPGLSDVSSLSSRFHPYKPPAIPGLGAPSQLVPAMPNLSHSGHAAALNMYYPYGLYGSRLVGPPHQ